MDVRVHTTGCIDTTDDEGCNGWTSAGSNTSVTLSNLTAGTTYYWQVRALWLWYTTYADAGDPTPYWRFATQPGSFTKNWPWNGATGSSTSPRR